MQFQGLQQVQRQIQTQVLAPQLRQSLKILQVPALDLRTTILEELQTNPTLEELPMDGISIEERSVEDQTPERETDGRELDFVDDHKALNQLNEDMREYYAEENAFTRYTSDDAERRQHFFDSLTSETSLQEHLMRQAEMSDVDPKVLAAFEFIIGSLDDKGFLTSSLPDIALMSELPLAAIEGAETLLRSLDPPGIGSSGIRDCLLTQLKLEGKEKSIAARIIADHFELLLRNRIPELARKTSSKVEDVQKAIEEISALDPAPGRRFAEDYNRVVIPDVRIFKDSDEWVVTLNSDYIPKLNLSDTYKNLIAKGGLPPKEREYIRDKIKSGRFLINSIEQRQNTVERIAREILSFQRDFFESGVSKLRPLTMSRIAEVVGVHETTISRAIANKYMETPHGVLSFKFFFTTGYTSHSGETVANTSIKELIAKIIEGEDSAKPYSDQQIVAQLASRDIKIARRTVAKYREELRIPPTNLRRQYN